MTERQDAATTVSLVSYNIQFTLGRDGRLDAGRCLESVAGADIIALQEVERFWKRTGCRDQVEEISRLMPDRYWVYGAPFDVCASYKEASGRVVNRRRQFGQMILSRWPILSFRCFPLPNHHVPNNMATGTVEAVIGHPAAPLRVYSAHLGDLTSDERVMQAARLRAIVAESARGGGVWTDAREDDPEHWTNDDAPPPMPEHAILLGDFNMDPGSPEYQTLAGSTNSCRPADGAPGFRDAWLLSGGTENDGITFPGGTAPYYDRPQRIDYCFVSDNLSGRLARCWVDQDAPGSDHQPVWAELELR